MACSQGSVHASLQLWLLRVVVLLLSIHTSCHATIYDTPTHSLSLQNYQRSKETEEKQKFKMSTAECKILFIVCYYMLVTVVAMSGLTVVSWKGQEFVKALFAYFLCQRSGYNPLQPCSRDRISQLHQAGLVAISFIFVGLLPLVNCIFTTNFREIATALCKCCSHRKEQPNKREAQSLIAKHSSKSHSDTENSTEHED